MMRTAGSWWQERTRALFDNEAFTGRWASYTIKQFTLSKLLSAEAAIRIMIQAIVNAKTRRRQDW